MATPGTVTDSLSQLQPQVESLSSLDANKRSVMNSGGETNTDSDVHSEAHYLFFIAAVGFLLNTTIILCVLLRQHLRRMTCAFLVHGCLLNICKCIFCVVFGMHLLEQTAPKLCAILGESHIIIVTSSAFNLIAIVCSEAYTFQEMNVGGNYNGSICCVIFGVMVVYFGSVILHLGPTIIGGYLEFHKEIGYCSFILGHIKSYVANMIWIVIVTLALVAAVYYISELYKEIQRNSPNRISMLVRTSVCLSENPLARQRSVKSLVQDSRHRVKVLIGVTIAFVICWYPYYALLIIDMRYKVSPPVYQTLCFLAWSHGTIEAFIYICFDRQLQLLSRLVYCRKYRFAYLDGISPLIRREQQRHSQMSYRRNADSRNCSLVAEAGLEDDDHETVIPNLSSTCNTSAHHGHVTIHPTVTMVTCNHSNQSFQEIHSQV